MAHDRVSNLYKKARQIMMSEARESSNSQAPVSSVTNLLMPWQQPYKKMEPTVAATPPNSMLFLSVSSAASVSMASLLIFSGPLLQVRYTGTGGTI